MILSDEALYEIGSCVVRPLDDDVAAMARELLAARAKLRRVEESLDGKLAKFEADLAEYAPVDYGEYSPSLCVKTARSLIRTALEGDTP